MTRVSPRPVAGGRCVAVDWSGARDEAAQRRHIWTAVVDAGELTECSGGRTRAETVDHLLALGDAGAELLVGLDFSFGFPAWFARALGCATGIDAWTVAAREAGGWIRDCPPPFFGATGTRRPPATELFRATEHAVRRATGRQPKSIFQLAGPGAVGIGSLRGMPLLARFRAAGWAVWPFDPPSARTVVELYPALAVDRTDRVVDPHGRRAFLDRRMPGITAAWPAAVTSRDAFDAVVAAFLLAGVIEKPFDRAARTALEETVHLEGAIWLPPGS